MFKFFSIKFLPIIVIMLISGNAFGNDYERDYIPNQVIIKYKDGIRATRSISAFSTERSLMKAESLPEFVSYNTFLINTVDNVTESIKALEDDTDIEYIQPNYIYYATAVPNDEYYRNIYTWGPPSNTPINYPYKSTNGLNLERAWDIITDAKDITVGVLDTGINLKHEDLAGNILDNGIDSFSNTTGAGKGKDDQGHGSHVAGIIGAVGNNGKGIPGVAWNVKLLALKVLGADGKGTSVEIARGINYAIDKRVNIINASLGSEFKPALASFIDPTQYQAVKKAIDNGIVFIAAAGNDNKNTDYQPEYPAAYGIRGLISVGASDSSSGLAIFNPADANSKTCFGQATVHLFAPGDAILSATHNFNTGDKAYVGLGGTSMATPFISGAVALLLTKNPSLTPAQVEMVLINSVRAVAPLKDYSMAGGVLDVAKMLNFNIKSLYETPKNLTITKRASANQTVDLSWDPHLGQTEIWYRNGDSGSFVYLDRLPAGTTKYVDRPTPNVFVGNRYYRIRSLKNAVYSPFVRVELAHDASGVITSREYVKLDNSLTGADISAPTRHNTPADMAPYVDKALKPLLTSDTSAIDFGSITVGNKSQAKQLTIINKGEASSVLTVSNSNKNNFSIHPTSTCLNNIGKPLEVGASCDILLTFNPADIGNITDRLIVGSDNNSVEVDLAGISVDVVNLGRLFVSSSQIDFMKKLLNTLSTENIVTVSNVGGATISVNIGKAPDGFRYTDNSTCSIGKNNLATSKSCILAISFYPTAVKSYSGEVVFTPSTGGEFALMLAGEGVLTKPDNGTTAIETKPVAPSVVDNNTSKKTTKGSVSSGGCSVGNGNIDYLIILLIAYLVVLTTYRKLKFKRF